MYLEGEKAITELQKSMLFNKFYVSAFTQKSYQKRFDTYAVMKIDSLQLHTIGGRNSSQKSATW